MKARIRQTTSCGMYWGQIFDEKEKRWKDVTSACFTEFGAKLELKQWKRKNCPIEFEI